jgi:hypothetical protein
MDALTKFENEFQKLRANWSKAQWRQVALKLAGIEIVQTKGRKKKTATKHDFDEQNLIAAKYQRDQKIFYKEVPNDQNFLKEYPEDIKKKLAHFENVNLEPIADLKKGFSVVPRKESEKITKKHALTQVVNEAVKKAPGIKSKPKVAGVTRQIQQLEKNKRIK